VKSLLSKALVGSGFSLLLVPGTAWLIFWSYFYLGLGLEGAVLRGAWHLQEVVATATLALCWFGVLHLWCMFFHFIQASSPHRPRMQLATFFAFLGAVQLTLAFPSMAVLRPLPEAGLCLTLHWGWLGQRGFGFGRQPAL
jgi:hypothetical protein